MSFEVREILFSSIVIVVAGFVTWPPGDAFWEWWKILPLRGGFTVLAIGTVVAMAIGLGTTSVGDIRASNFAIGSVLAYSFGTALIQFVFLSDDPLYLYAYGYGLPSDQFLYTHFVAVALLGAASGKLVGGTRNTIRRIVLT